MVALSVKRPMEMIWHSAVADYRNLKWGAVLAGLLQEINIIVSSFEKNISLGLHHDCRCEKMRRFEGVNLFCRTYILIEFETA